jgi:hypothetical protein
VIVAVTLGLAGQPKLSVIPGSEYQTESECVQATHVRANFDADRRDVAFSVCMPKDSVHIGRPGATEPSKPPVGEPGAGPG